ncbi:MAG: hypothetical protein NVS4B5_12530 [Vulcanimicrobiaceae bacterium]
MRSATIALALAAALASNSQGARAALSQPARSVLTTYLDALEHERYDVAFARLSAAERRYFRSAANFAAVFRADRLRIHQYAIVGSTTVATGTVAIVREEVAFFDHAHQRTSEVRANVRYAIVPTPDGVAVKDPYHPWYAFAPPDATAESHAVRATLRKVSFFTGRVELLVTFENRGDTTVTFLPYGRSVLRDGAARFVPLATKIPGLTDRTLFEGLRLAPNARYTGALTFVTRDRYRPASLALTIAPALLDGADAPFELPLPPVALPATP